MCLLILKADWIECCDVWKNNAHPANRHESAFKMKYKTVIFDMCNVSKLFWISIEMELSVCAVALIAAKSSSFHDRCIMFFLFHFKSKCLQKIKLLLLYIYSFNIFPQRFLSSPPHMIYRLFSVVAIFVYIFNKKFVFIIECITQAKQIERRIAELQKEKNMFIESVSVCFPTVHIVHWRWVWLS